MGPDSALGWLVLAASAWVDLWCAVLPASSGVLFVAIVAALGVSYGQAAWPLSLINTLYQLTGPVTGVLIVRGHVRILSLLGVLLTISASVFCFVRFDYIGLLVFLPLAGIGQGLCTPVNSVLVNQYFERHLSRASGVSLAGATLAAFLFPPAVTLLLEAYGLRGALLLTGGLAMHALAGAVLLRPAPWTMGDVALRPRPRPRRQLDTGAPHAGSPDEQEFLNAAVRMSKVSSVAMDASAADLAFVAYQQAEERSEPPEEEVVIYEMQRRNQSPVYQPTVLTLPRTFTLSPRATWTAFLRKPFYYLLAAHWVCSSYANFCLLLTLVDVAREDGASSLAAAFLLSAYSVGDLLGRLFSGWLSDKRILSRTGVMALSCAMLTALLLVLPHLSGYVALLAASVMAGWCVGSCAILFSVMLASVAGLENLPIAVGFTTFLMGFATLARPGLISLFRDTLGSYCGLYVAHGVVYGVLFVAYVAHSLYRGSLKCKSLREGC